MTRLDTLGEALDVSKNFDGVILLNRIKQAFEGEGSTVVDAELLEKCRGTLEQMRDGTLVSTARALERVD